MVKYSPIKNFANQLISSNKAKYVSIIIFIIFLPLSLYLFSSEEGMSKAWIFPYLSGAANFENLKTWNISPSDYDDVLEISEEDYWNYKHQRTGDTIAYSTNFSGYVLVALTSRTIFPFLGDIQGLVNLQVSVHIIMTLFLLLFVFQTPFQRIGFVFLYSLNPLIILITTFPFYYFWLSLHSFLFIILIYKREWIGWFAAVSMPILLILFTIRPTILFLTIFFFVMSIYLSRKKKDIIVNGIASLFFAVSALFIMNTQIPNGPWHQFYIGIGAYDNNFGIQGFDDSEGFRHFQDVTGIEVNTDPIDGNWNDYDFRVKYGSVMRDSYTEILQKEPLLILQNAVFNNIMVFSVFSPRKITERVILGLLVIVFLFWTKQHFFLLAVFLSAASFSFYTPPAVQYNFAAYMLLVVGTLSGLEKSLRLIIQKLDD